MAAAYLSLIPKKLYPVSVCFHLLLLLLCSGIAVSRSTVRSLPGFAGSLPFELETGYVGVDESNDVQLFYYFVKSQRNPREDPLLLWFSGGPRCSVLTGLAFSIGPLYFKISEYNGSLPTLMLNPNSWTKVSSIIFLDAPVGTGFSYSRSVQGSNTGDIKSAKQTYNFLRKWFIDHPEFLSNALYVGGDSYSGMTVPIIVQDISDGIEAGHKPVINLKVAYGSDLENLILRINPTDIISWGFTQSMVFIQEINYPIINLGYLLGNPVTGGNLEKNSKIPFAYRMGLLSDELYESIKKNCGEEYVNVDPNNALCIKDLQAFSECTSGIAQPHILEPNCLRVSPKPKYIMREGRSLDENSSKFVYSPPPFPALECKTYGYMLSYYWANNDSVQKALNIEKGTVQEWIRCNFSLPYIKDVKSSVKYHRTLSNRGYRSLIYSGDHDMMVPFLSTQAWIRSLNYSIIDDWRPWFVDGQVGGYTRTYSNK